MKNVSRIVALLTASSLSATGSAADAPAAEARDGQAQARRGAACAGPASTDRAGELDATFGQAGTGIARLRFGADDDGKFVDLALLDGAIVAAGWGMGGLGGSRFRIARLTDAGAPDPAFGGGGMVSTGWASSTGDYVYAVAAGHQRDGGLIAMGWRDRFRGASADVALARYRPDGSLDAGHFGDGGKSLLDLGGDEEIQDGLVLQNDRIVVVGKRDDRLVIARATASGALDTSFARPRGYQAVAVGSASAAQAVALDRRGRLVVAGHADRGGQRDMVVLRFLPNGALDPSFGRGGVVVAGDPAVDERAVAVALAPDGAIVVAGDAGPEGARDLEVRRFLADGAPDLAFGHGGVTEPTGAAGSAEARDMVLLPDGGVLVVGNEHDAGEMQPLAARYTCTGALDLSFGESGVIPLDLGEYGEAHAVELYGDDRVLIGGGDVGMSPGPGTYGVVARMWL